MLQHRVWKSPKKATEAIGPLKMYQAISIGSLALIPLCYFLISQNHWMTYLLTGLFILGRVPHQRGFKKEKYGETE